MRALEFKPTDHNYYCCDTRWNQRRDEKAEFECWEDFKAEWGIKDKTFYDHYNHLFRFDLQYKYEDETDDNTGPMQLLLFFMLQRKGLFVPVTVNNITEAEMPEITEFLQKRWEYIKTQWCEFSGHETKKCKKCEFYIKPRDGSYMFSGMCYYDNPKGEHVFEDHYCSRYKTKEDA